MPDDRTEPPALLLFKPGDTINLPVVVMRVEQGGAMCVVRIVGAPSGYEIPITWEELSVIPPSRRPGLPPDGDPRQFIGFDKDGHAYVLEWRDGITGNLGQLVEACWMGMGIDRGDEIRLSHPLPLCFLAREEMAGFIVEHAEVPR